MSCQSIRAYAIAVVVFTLLTNALAFAQPVCNAPLQIEESRRIGMGSNGFVGPTAPSDFFGLSAVAIGDVDGDGTPDLAVGAPGDDDGGVDRGAVWILFMNPNGSVRNAQKISSTSGGFGIGLSDTDWFGETVARLGDWDRDGVADVAVGAMLSNDGDFERGAIWILLLNPDGTVKRKSKISSTAGGLTTLDGWNSRFGTSIARLDDLDGDDVPELAVGAWRQFTTGSVHILFMNGDGTVKSSTVIATGRGGFNAVLDQNDGFGTGLALLSDLDGNGVRDLAVGTGFDDDGGRDAGAIWILFMNRDGTVAAQRKISANTDMQGVIAEGSVFGGAIGSLGDLDGDGVAELVAGQQPDGGAAWVLYLDSMGSVRSRQRLERPSFAVGSFGMDGSAVGDLDGDGTVEIVIGTSTYSTDFRGEAWLLSLRICPSVPPRVVRQPESTVVPPAHLVQLTVHAEGSVALSYQWKKDGIALVDNADLVGSASNQLSFLSSSDAIGAYSCVVSNPYGSVTSQKAVVAVRVQPVCRADYNFSGSVSTQDVFDFLHAYFQGCP